MTDPATRYIDLLVECVNGSIHGGASQLEAVRPASGWRRRAAGAMERRGRPVARRTVVPNSAYERGVGWPEQRWNPGESMVGRARLRQLSDALRSVVAADVPGNVIETGVWRGGSCILARGVLEALGDPSRKVYVADSFQGLPPAHVSDDAASLHDDTTLAVSQAEVAEAFERYGLLDDRVVFVEGWFCDTLPALRDVQWSVVRLDGDMYESTMDGLANLYPQLSPGGYLIVDDYFTYESCRSAVDEYRASHHITADLTDIDGSGAFWRA